MPTNRANEPVIPPQRQRQLEDLAGTIVERATRYSAIYSPTDLKAGDYRWCLPVEEHIRRHY